MSAGPSPNGATAPGLPTTNREFLERLFGRNWPYVHVCAIPGDPNDPTIPRGYWAGGPAHPGLSACEPDTNNYYCVGLFAGARQLANFRALVILGIDDVGPKVDPVKVRDLLGEPSYRIETSPGNEHWGYRLRKPLTHGDGAVEFQRKVRKWLTAKDPGMEGLNRYLRLPFGRNGKADCGPGGFGCRLVAWTSRMLEESEVGVIAGAVGVTEGVDAGPVGAPTGMVHTPGTVASQADLEADPLLRALMDLGLVQSGPRPSPMGPAYDITCPWVGEHTGRATSGTVYVPVRTKFRCQHGHCEKRTHEHLRLEVERLLREDSGGLQGLVHYEFDKIDPATVPLVTVTGGGWSDKPWNPFVVPALPRWPGDILPGTFEATLRSMARRDGMDFAALATAFVVVASGMADKRARLQPLQNTDWEVPPILWAAFIADSGRRKSGTLNHALRPLRQAHTARMRDFMALVARWRARPPANKADPRPDDPPQLLVQDVTVEKLQMIIQDNPRGPLYLRDELAGLFDFGRYAGAGIHERAFFLESYEGNLFTVNRVGRPLVHLDNCALTIMGGIQADKLATLGDLTTDGLLQRFGTIRLDPKTPGGEPSTTVSGLDQLEAAMTRLLTVRPVTTYLTDAAGHALIEQTMRVGEGLAQIPDFGKGFTGFAGKLHGTQARAALVLHLLDLPGVEVIPVGTVRRAGRFARFLLEHAQQFYGALPGATEHMARAVASYVLRKGLSHLVASDLTRNVAACRGMTLKQLNEAVSRLVAEDWLRPQQRGLDNRRWAVRPDLQKTFPDELQAEIARVNKIKSDMNWHGVYR